MVYYKCNLSMLTSGHHTCFYARGKGKNSDLLYTSRIYKNEWKAKFVALSWFLMASPSNIISFENDLQLPNATREHWLSDEEETETTFGIVQKWVFTASLVIYRPIDSRDRTLPRVDREFRTQSGRASKQTVRYGMPVPPPKKTPSDAERATEGESSPWDLSA